MEQLDSSRFPDNIRKDLDDNVHMHSRERFGRGRISIHDPMLGDSYECDLTNQTGTYLQKYTLKESVKKLMYILEDHKLIRVLGIRDF